MHSRQQFQSKGRFESLDKVSHSIESLSRLVRATENRGSLLNRPGENFQLLGRRIAAVRIARYEMSLYGVEGMAQVLRIRTVGQP